MILKKNTIIATGALLLSLLFGSAAYADNDDDDDKDKGSSKYTSSKNGGKHDWDRDDGSRWGDDDEDDWKKSWDDWKKDWDDGKKYGSGHSSNGKVFICHRTSSSKNPYVLIQVSTSAQQAHYDHGDPVSFTAKSDGKCSPGGSTPDPTASLSLAKSEIAINTTTTATWTSTHATSCKLDGNTVATSGSASVGPYSSTGYKTITLVCTGAGGSDTDTEKLKVVGPPEPNVSLRLSDDDIYTGATATATWSSTNATSCTLDGNNVALSGSATVGPYSSTGYKTITVSCTGAGGTDSDSETLKVRAAPAAPTLSLSIAPTEILVGAKAKLSWDSSNASSCKLTLSYYSSPISISTDGYFWKGPYDTAGERTFTVTCTNAAGATVTKTVTLVVKDIVTAPTVTLTLSPASVVQNTGRSTVTWSSTNATSCTISGGGLASNLVVGPAPNPSAPVQVGPFTTLGSQTVTISCQGAAGTTPATASQTLTVTAPPVPNPTVTLTLSPAEVVQGTGRSTLTWTTANATGCTISGAGLPSTAVGPGPDNLNPLRVGPFSTVAPQTVTITCQGVAGSTPVTTTQTLAVVPASIVELSACSRLDSSTTIYYWAVNYNPATGQFNGISTGGVGNITGTIVPAGDIMVAGKVINFSVDELVGVGVLPSDIRNLGPSGSSPGVPHAYFVAPVTIGGSPVQVAVAFASGNQCYLTIPR